MDEVVTGGNSSGPTSFSDSSLTWSDASPASTPESPSTTPPAAAQPGTDSALPQTEDERSPFIPRPRFDEVNAKKAELETALSEWQQYAWAKQVNQSDLSEAIRIAQLSKADPITYLQDFIKDLQTHPTYGAQLKSLAAKALSQRSQPQGPQMVNVQLEDGTVVEMPRNPGEWLAAQKQQWLQEAEQKFQPFTKTVEQMQAERTELAKQQQVTQFVTSTEADVKTWPGMDTPENRKAVAEELARMTVNEDDPRDVSLALNAAYRKVMLPKLHAQSESSVLENLQRKAAASTSVNPASAAASAPGKVSSFFDKSLQW